MELKSFFYLSFFNLFNLIYLLSNIHYSDIQIFSLVSTLEGFLFTNHYKQVLGAGNNKSKPTAKAFLNVCDDQGKAL